MEHLIFDYILLGFIICHLLEYIERSICIKCRIVRNRNDKKDIMKIQVFFWLRLENMEEKVHFFFYVSSWSMKYSLHCISEFAKNKTLQFSFLFECKTVHAENIYFYMRFLLNKRIERSFSFLKYLAKKISSF